MATITMSSKSQITLPAEMVRGLSLKPGDKLIAQLIEDHIVLLPKPESWTDYFMGSTKGFWGTKEEIDSYIAEERRSPERDEWREQFDDLVATDEDVRAVVEALASCGQCTASPNQLHRVLRGEQHNPDSGRVLSALEKLVKHGGVRRIRLDGPELEVYRLVHELAVR